MKIGVQEDINHPCNETLPQSFNVFGVDDQHLVHYADQNIKIHPQLLTAFNGLVNKAGSAGFDLRIASGFRSFDRQLLIWNSKANGLRPVLDAAGKVIDLTSLTDDEKVFAILGWSALPGASRHHWGTDIDIYDASRMPIDYQVQLTVAECEGDGVCAEFHRWLTQELQQTSASFYRPYVAGVGSISPEPWHLSYTPLAQLFSAQLTESMLREKITTTDIVLKSSILKNLTYIFNHYIKPYQ